VPFIPPRARAVLSILLAWLALVGCRIFARLISVGAGERGVVGLTILTMAVNAYWLVAGPLLARFRQFALARWRRAGAIMTIAGAGAVVVLAEPAWYGPVLRAFSGVPLPWREAVIFRGDVNLLVVALILAAGWLRDGFDRAIERQRQRGELEAVLADAELRSLALQLQPHFLFNALQLAAEAAYDDIAEARVIVCELQTLLRRAFELEERSLVRIAEEIEFLGAYVAIQQRRFGRRLHVAIHVDPTVRDLLLPPLLIQPLVENSIRHGIGPLARNGKVVVEVSSTDERLLIRVSDNGVGFSSNTRLDIGLGLGVTQRRLDALFPGRYSIDAGNAPDGGASVSIEIPIVRREADPRTTSTKHQAAPVVDPRSWSGPAAVAIGAGSALLLADVLGSAYLFETTSRAPHAITVAPIAAWIPAQLLAFALGIVLWRGRSVRRWLQRRDAETLALNGRITETRQKVTDLRAGKDVMISALDRLAMAADAREFDDLTLAAAESVRSLLASDRDSGHSPGNRSRGGSRPPISAEV
jgi:two-component system LytT family sensor kinase